MQAADDGLQVPAWTGLAPPLFGSLAVLHTAELCKND